MKTVQLSLFSFFLLLTLLPFKTEALEFPHQCAAEDRVTIAGVGDLLFHRRLQVQAYTRTDGFKTLWAPVADLLKDADITYANLEGPVAPLPALSAPAHGKKGPPEQGLYRDRSRTGRLYLGYRSPRRTG